jgi:hypothetical protein
LRIEAIDALVALLLEEKCTDPITDFEFALRFWTDFDNRTDILVGG